MTMPEPKQPWWRRIPLPSPFDVGFQRTKWTEAGEPTEQARQFPYELSEKDYLRIMEIIIEGTYGAGTEEAKAKLKQVKQQIAFQGMSPSLPNYGDVFDILSAQPAWKSQQEARVMETAREGATEVLKGQLYQGTAGMGGLWFNKEGQPISEDVALWMLDQAGRQKGTGGKVSELPEPSGLESSLDVATTSRQMGRKVAWLEGQKRELAGLQSPRDWITRWQTQYQDRPSFRGVTPWSMRTPEERGAELGKGEWGDYTWGQLASGYRSKADYEAAIGRAREFGTEPFMEGTVSGPEPASFGGEGGKKEGNYTSPNAPKRTGPPVPDWITRYVPALRGGVGLFKQDPGLLPTPSPYQMAQLNPSQQQQLAGYWDWYQGLNPSQRADVEARYQGRPYGTLREMSEARQFSKLNPPKSWDDIMAEAGRVVPRGIPRVRRRGALRQT